MKQPKSEQGQLASNDGEANRTADRRPADAPQPFTTDIEQKALVELIVRALQELHLRLDVVPDFSHGDRLVEALAYFSSISMEGFSKSLLENKQTAHRQLQAILFLPDAKPRRHARDPSAPDVWDIRDRLLSLTIYTLNKFARRTGLRIDLAAVFIWHDWDLVSLGLPISPSPRQVGESSIQAQAQSRWDMARRAVEAPVLRYAEGQMEPRPVPATAHALQAILDLGDEAYVQQITRRCSETRKLQLDPRNVSALLTQAQKLDLVTSARASRVANDGKVRLVLLYQLTTKGLEFLANAREQKVL